MFTYCTCYITLCWQLSMRYICWSWKQPLKLISSFVLLQCLYFEFIALWVTLMQVLLMLVLKVLFMKSLCYMIHLFTHYLHHCFESLHSSHMLYNSMIKIMIAYHFRNYLCYRLPTRGRVGTKLGDAWYVPNVSIISYVSCYFYDDTHMFYIHYMSLLCIFRY